MLALVFGLMALTPAPIGTQFKTTQEMEVIGVVKEPFDPIIPARVYDTSGHDPREVGWAWKQTFQEFGVTQLNVCRGKDKEIYLCPPYMVWMNKKK